MSDDTNIKRQKMTSDDTSQATETSDDTSQATETSDDTNQATETSDDTSQATETSDDTNQATETSDDTSQATETSDDTNQATETSDDTSQATETSDDTNQATETSDDTSQATETSDDTNQATKTSDDTSQATETSDDIGQAGNTILPYDMMSFADFADYKNKKQERLAELTKDTEKDLQEKFFTYGKEELGLVPKGARDFAKSALVPGEIFSNDDEGDDDDGDDLGDLGKLRHQWFNTSNERLLLLGFPRQTDKISLEEDTKLRQNQFINLLKNYSEETKKTKEEKNIVTWDEFSSCIYGFLTKDCLHTKLATIVFNGHGSRKGLCFNHSGTIPLNKIIAEIQKCIDAMDEDNTRLNPRAVDIIFGQCHGHEHSAAENEWNKLNVICLTSRKMPKTHTSTIHYPLESTVVRRNDPSDESLLMLGFPLTYQTHYLSSDFARQRQNEEFVTMYGINIERVSHASIECFSELVEKLKGFLYRGCSNTKLATVVFNGDGKRKGLMFKSGECIPLDQIIENMLEITKSVSRKHENPKQVSIIFAQSFGHMFSYNSTSSTIAMDVVSLTSEKMRLTLSGSFPTPVHYQLMAYAKKMLAARAQSATVDIDL